MPGLDKSYSSQKRALVRRNLRKIQGSPNETPATAVPRGQPAQPGSAANQISEAMMSQDEAQGHAAAPEDLDRYENRLVGTQVDNVMAFDPFASTVVDLPLLEQRLCRHCEFCNVHLTARLLTAFQSSTLEIACSKMLIRIQCWCVQP